MDNVKTLIDPPPKPKLPKNLTEKLSLFDLEPMELTRQLSLLCFGTYVSVSVLKLPE